MQLKKTFNIRYDSYTFINNSLGWFCFLVAAVTYLLTLEPTASFWDCPEFISQGYKLEVGHPPGNPIFMLTARFFITITGAGPESVAVVVNAMSALLSAATILLLFWTITYLVRMLMIGRKGDDALTLLRTVIIMASGLCGALMFTWSDTFWFSAVEGEVYAFSSFCTALVFWLILKWDARAEHSSSDKYLILIAYVIGISIAVHLLNLLTIPALALVVYYRKRPQSTWKGMLLTLLISFGVIALILYGLVPGFIGIAQFFELLFVNSLGMSYNIGVLVYVVLLVSALVWCIRSLYRQTSPWQIRISFLLSVFLSGMPFIGSSWFIPALLIVALSAYLLFARNLHFRLLSIVAVSIFVIFIGYSSYALLLIRSAANPPMNQSAVDNVFSLGSYLDREQYGDTPLFYGPQFTSPVQIRVSYQPEKDDDGNVILDDNGKPYMNLASEPVQNFKRNKYAKEVDGAPHYTKLEPEKEYEYLAKVFFPRMYEGSQHTAGYLNWIGLDSQDGLENQETVIQYVDEKGNPAQIMTYDNMEVRDARTGQPIFNIANNPIATGELTLEDCFVITPEGPRYMSNDLAPYLSSRKESLVRLPSFGQNLQYFFRYQLNHMYWRYFMWNFAGRQNDYPGEGEVNKGNWISGIPFIDNARLGDQSLLPDEYGKGNKGHNVFFMLPLFMGLLGIAIQLYRGKQGVQQFWVVFFFFFMTGIAIVLYLNQYPNQPRERDYAFAGSFYAFAIWVGIGVYALWKLLEIAFKKWVAKNSKVAMVTAGFACFVALFVPLQVVSQTWDDHDRSGRYTTRDFGRNYLNSLEQNAIIFTNGDNDTFPLWYVQEVLGERTDVRVVNLAYLQTDWYIDQMRMPAYNAPGVEMQIDPAIYRHDKLQYVYNQNYPGGYASVTDALNLLYNEKVPEGESVKTFYSPVMIIPFDAQAAVEAGVLTQAEADEIDEEYILVNLPSSPDDGSYTPYRQLTISNLVSLDIINTSILNGWKRPVYFAVTVPSEYYLNFDNLGYLRSTGLAYQVSPYRSGSDIDTDRMYRNVTEKFVWGGLDQAKDGSLYIDDTVKRMIDTHRSMLLDLANALIDEGRQADEYYYGMLDIEEGEDYTVPAPIHDDPVERYQKAITILELMDDKLPYSVSRYSLPIGHSIALAYIDLAALMRDNEQLSAQLVDKADKILRREIVRYKQFIPYFKDQLRHEGKKSIAELNIDRFDKYVPIYLVHLSDLYAQVFGEDKLNEIIAPDFKDFSDLATTIESMGVKLNND